MANTERAKVVRVAETFADVAALQAEGAWVRKMAVAAVVAEIRHIEYCLGSDCEMSGVARCWLVGGSGGGGFGWRESVVEELIISRCPAVDGGGAGEI